MNISENLSYLPTFIAATILIALAVITIVGLPWSLKDFRQGHNEALYIYDVFKGFLKENFSGFLDIQPPPMGSVGLKLKQNLRQIPKQKIRCRIRRGIRNDITGIRRRAV
jgi:hypothetical protein